MSENINDDLIDSTKRSVEFGRDTKIVCPSCGHGETPNTLRIRSEIEDTITLECPNCTYTEHRPKNSIRL